MRETSGLVLFTVIFSLVLIVSPALAQQVIGTVSVGGGSANPVAVGVNSSTNFIYVVDQDSDQVSVISGSNLMVAATVQVGDMPNLVVVNSVTNQIYVTNEEDMSVTVINGTNNSTQTIPNAAMFPVAMALDPIANKVYIVDLDNSDVVVIDGATLNIATVPVGMDPDAIAVNTATNQIYVANVCANPSCVNGTVSVIDGATLQVSATVNVGVNPNDIAINELTDQIYVTNGSSPAGTVTVIDGATNTFSATVNVGNMPDTAVVNPVTNQIYVGNLDDNTVTVINANAQNETTTISSVPEPVSAGVDAATNKIYVVSGEINLQEVIMIDGNTNNTTTIPMVGHGPYAVGVDTVTNRIYVTNGTDGTVSVIAGASAAAVQFVSLTPCRLFDTRPENGGSGPILGGTSETFVIPGAGNPPCTSSSIPANAAAFSLNVTVLPKHPLNYLTIWPTGEDQPFVSTLNSPDGRTKANAAIVPAGYLGAVNVYVTDTSNLILDINGYFVPQGTGTLQFYTLPPCRVVDTRSTSMLTGGLGPPSFQAMEVRDLPILTSTCLAGVTNAVAYSFNATVVPYPSGQQLGYLTLWPSNETQPYVSTLNNPTATVVANGAIVPADPSNGNIKAFTFNSTDLIIDIDGYFAPPGGENGYSLYPAAPCRVYDSRLNGGMPFSGERTVPVAASPCSPPANAGGYVFNATVVPSGLLGYLTLWPDQNPQQPPPFASTLNAYDGLVTSNIAIVPNMDGSTDSYLSDLGQLILDIAGYFAP